MHDLTRIGKCRPVGLRPRKKKWKSGQTVTKQNIRSSPEKGDRHMVHAGAIRWHILIMILNLFLVDSATADEDGAPAPPDSTQADQELHEMETLVVTASRKEQVIEEVPASVTVPPG